MATTTNYGWETPDDTDLVKDGALAQRTTANAIDSSMYAALNGKPAGLVLLNTTTFSSATNVDVTSVFSSTYDNYRFEVALSGGTTGAILRYHLLSGSTPASTSYYWASGGLSYGGSTNNSTASNQSFGYLGDIGSNAAEVACAYDLIKPNVATFTRILGHHMFPDYGRWLTGVNANQTSYDGIRFSLNTGTLSGTVSIYGYKK